MLLRLIILFSFVVCSYQKTTYHGYQVIQTDKINSKEVILDLIQYVKNSGESAYDFWVQPKTLGDYAKIMITPGYFVSLESFLNSRNIKFAVIIQDVERVNRISEMEQKLQKERRVNASSSIDWQNYYGVEDIYAYLNELQEGKDYITVETYGKSFEKRDLKLIKIAKAGKDAPNIFIEAGIHAREWIAPAMGTYIIHSLLEVEENAHYLDKFNFHIIPSANPDGYEYSRSSSRLWRKTRSKDETNPNCVGVDPNRNWAYHWHESGVNDDPCSEIFPGPEPFSESETEAIRNYVEKLSPTPVLSLCLHSAANLWLVPYGYAYDVFPENYDELMGLAKEAVDTLNSVHNAGFSAINSADLYPAAGASDDWYVGVLGSRFGYTVELRQGGIYGFDLPANQIIPSGEELWEAVKVVFNKMHEVSNE